MKWSSSRELLTFVHDHRLIPPTADRSLLENVRRLRIEPRQTATSLLGLELLTAYQARMLISGSKSDLVFGPYRLLDRLGVNSVSCVFHARDTRTNQEVALKVLTELAQSSEENQRRFRREIRAAQSLYHPNIVRTLEAQLTDTTGYLAMEYLPGSDLRKVLEKQTWLPISRGCDYARQAATGLQHAHELGLVHRDIKPGNLMICGTTVKILDFGLVRRHAGTTGDSFVGSSSSIGNLLGTADYMSPEQAINPSGVDIRTDIYSLGCTLFEAIAGEATFAGGSAMQKLYRHQNEEPRRLDAVRRGVPPELADVVATMLKKNPDERFGTPAEVAARLEAFC